jgi:hypothetical protein
MGGEAPALTQDGKFDLGLRANILAGDGEPTNDVLGYGLFGHVPLNDRWSIGFAIDHSPEFDVERTAKIVGFERTSRSIRSKASAPMERPSWSRPTPGRSSS